MAIEANIIKIKRSGTSGAPASLKLGELAYSYLTASGNPTSNGGDRLFIGANGVNGGTGNANDGIVIGGKYFTDLLDHERGILTASSALVVDASKKLDELLVDNLSLNGNTLSTTDTNGNLTLSPNGTGLVSIAGAFTLPRVDGTNGYVLTTNGAGVVSWQQSAATLNIAGTTGTDGISLLSETLTFAGATIPVSVAVTANTVTIAVADATTSAKGLASFDTTDFTVTAGAVTVKEERIQDIVGAMIDSNTESGISVTYDDTNGKLDFNVSDPVITIDGDVDGFATMTNLGNTTITVTLDTVNTNVGTFGSSTSIPVITVNGKGLITGVTTQSISTTLNIAGGTGTDAVSLGSDTLTFAGSGAISTAVTNNQVAISVATATSSVLGVASFNSTDFTVATGAVTVNEERIQDIIGAMVDSNTETNASVTYDDTTGKLNFSVATATSSTLGVASFNTASFTVTAGDVTIKTGGVSNSQLANSTISGVSLGSNLTDLTAGTNLAFDTGTTYNGGTAKTISLASALTSVNSVSSSAGTGAVTLNASGGHSYEFKTDGTVTFNSAYTFPAARASTAGYVLTDAAGNGTLSWAAAASTLNIAGTTGTDGISLLSETLTFAGGTTPISVAVTANTVTISVADATTSAKGLASFNSTDFTVTTGAVTVNEERIQDIVGAMVSTNSETNITVSYDDPNGKLDFSVATATSSVLGVASFNTASFTVTAGDVTIKSAGVSNTQLANSSVTVGSTSISLGATSTSLTGLTQIDVDNITINGNEISSTDTNGNISLNPNGTGTVAVNSSRITGLADPTDAQDAATKAYVDARSAGLDPKASVRAATTANITLSNTQTVDGVALVVGNRVLVKDQTTASQNGIYIVASGAWTRSADMDEPAEMSSGVFFFVEEGTANADAGFVITTDGGTIVVGTDAVNFTQFSGAGQIVAGDGLTKSGNTLSVNVAANGGIEISADALQLKSTVAGNGLTYTNGVVDVAGTTDRISVSADAVDISANYVGQTSITTLGTITSGTWTATTIATTRGGTGLTTYAAGDLLYSDASNSLAKLAKPAATSLLTMDNAGAPTWAALSNTGITGLGTVTTGTWQATTIASAYGGTGITTYAKGDFLYASAANTLSKLTAGTNGQTLQLQDGVPYWGDLDGGTY
jgi:hypothetical protein